MDATTLLKKDHDAVRQLFRDFTEEEEAAMFAQARIHLTDERLERLGRDMAVLRENLGGEPVAVGSRRDGSGGVRA